LIEGKHPFKAVYINAAFSNLTGLSSDSVLGKNFEKFLPSDTISDILARSGTVNHHVVTIDPSGGTVQDCSHGNIYFECSITMTLVCPPSYLLVELSKSFESSPTVDIFSEIELVSLVGDDVTEIIEPFSLVG
jgi:PAS domain-containing protein